MSTKPEQTKHCSSADDSKAWLEQLAGEYRIIQDKIDKIAGSRFTIRGWSVTLVVALGFGANTLKLPPYWICSAFLPVVAFLLMERSQHRYGDILGVRAIEVEQRIWRILRLGTPKGSRLFLGGRVPGIAHGLGEENQLSNPLWRKCKSYGYIFFYGAQIVLVLAAVWLSRHQQQASDELPPGGAVINNLSPGSAIYMKGVPDAQTPAER